MNNSRNQTMMIVLTLLLPLVPSAFANDGIFFGQVTVVDGDTLKYGKTRVRLFGIDSPESSQLCYLSDKPWRCGQKAALALDQLIGRKHVECKTVGTGRYKRPIVRCFLDGIEINRWLVVNGWAVEWRRYSKGIYTSDENIAKSRSANIWSSRFIEPWKWRKGKRLK